MKTKYSHPALVNCVNNLQEYTNAFYLVNNSCGQEAYLIDINNLFIAASHEYLLKNNIVNENLILGKSFGNLNIVTLSIYKLWNEQIAKINQQIRVNKEKQIFLEIAYDQATPNVSIVYRTPIYTKTGDFLCIHVLRKPFTLARLANLGAKFYNITGYPTKLSEFQDVNLSRMQTMILYLYARNYSYTEISTWLSRIGHKISPGMVNKHLKQMKEILNVKDKDSLRDMSLKCGYDVAVPIEFFPEGVYDITDDVFNLWIC